MSKRNLSLDWNGYYPYDYDSVNKHAPITAGVYKIALMQNDGDLRVIYVGQTDNHDRRLKEHLDFRNEQNVKLVESLKKYQAHFSYAKAPLKEDRDGAERALYLYYGANLCNDPDAIPNGPDIEINYR